MDLGYITFRSSCGRASLVHAASGGILAASRVVPVRFTVGLIAADQSRARLIAAVLTRLGLASRSPPNRSACFAICARAAPYHSVLRSVDDSQLFRFPPVHPAAFQFFV